jgi:hypothetical protein
LDRLERLKKVREKTLCNLANYESPAFFASVKPNEHFPDAEGRITVIKIPDDPTLEGDAWKLQ